MQNILEAKDLKKVFYKNRVPFEAVDGVSFHIGKGECLGLAGESGCGKSTIAKIITRLIMPEEGSVRLDGKVQMVFQTPQDSFDPRRTLGDGIMEGMRNQGMGKKQAKERACEMLDLVELDRRFFYRYPHEASGGECQRAAIARALALKPDILCFDEPTSALDPELTGEVLKVIKGLADQETTMIIVTHEMAFARGVSSQVIFMDGGRIMEQGTPEEVFEHPREERTRQFLSRFTNQ